MARQRTFPAHVDPSIGDMNDIFLGLGGLGYTICYVLMTRQSIRDHTYAMPLFSLAFNFAWEIIFALYVAQELQEQLAFATWMIIDLGLVYAVVVYGANEWKHAPLIGRNIGKIFAAMLAWWCVALYAISTWWLDVDNPVNPKPGKEHRGVQGIDSDELGFWTALVAQVVLSGMSLGQLMVRQSTRGSSYGIWATRFIGSIMGLNVNYGYCWWVWPEAHAYFTHPFAVLMLVTWVVADLGYILLFWNLQRAQTVKSKAR